MAEEKEMNAFGILDELLKKTNLNDVSADSTGFDELKEGYYKMEVKKGQLKVNSSGNPMASLQLKSIKDGVSATFGENDVTLTPIPNTKNITVFKNYVLNDEKKLKTFVSDMMKFEDEDGNPVLPEEVYTDSETLGEAIACLEESQIWIQVTKSEKDGKESTWYNLISWKRVADLELEAEDED